MGRTSLWLWSTSQTWSLLGRKARTDIAGRSPQSIAWGPSICAGLSRVPSTSRLILCKDSCVRTFWAPIMTSCPAECEENFSSAWTVNITRIFARVRTGLPSVHPRRATCNQGRNLLRRNPNLTPLSFTLFKRRTNLHYQIDYAQVASGASHYQTIANTIVSAIGSGTTNGQPHWTEW